MCTMKESSPPTRASLVKWASSEPLMNYSLEHEEKVGSSPRRRTGPTWGHPPYPAHQSSLEWPSVPHRTSGRRSLRHLTRSATFLDLDLLPSLRVRLRLTQTSIDVNKGRSTLGTDSTARVSPSRMTVSLRKRSTGPFSATSLGLRRKDLDPDAKETW